MATVAAPYGLRPVNLIGGQPYAGSVREIKIASAYAANIFYGQPVIVTTNGVLNAETGTSTVTATGVAGVFLGCSYTDATLGKVFRQYWPTGTVAADAVGYVADDPDIVMQIQADGSVAQTALGANIGFGTSAGSTSTGNATTPAATSTLNTTASLPLRIIGFVNGPTSAVGDAYTDILVKWNMPYSNANVMTGGHAYMNPTGI